MVKLTFGQILLKELVSRAAQVSAVGITAIFSVPESPCLLKRISSTKRFEIADNPPRPDQRALPLRRQPAKTGAALDELHAKLIFQLPDAGGKRRLGDAKALCGAPEMALLGECDEHFQLPDHMPCSGCRAPVSLT